VTPPRASDTTVPSSRKTWIRATVALFAAVTAGALLATPSSAAPQPSIAELQRQADAKGRQLDATIEVFNLAVANTNASKKRQAAVTKKVAALEKRFPGLAKQADSVVNEAYRTGNRNALAALSGSDSSRTWLDRATTLKYISHGQKGHLKAYLDARRQLDDERDKIDREIKTRYDHQQKAATAKAKITKDLKALDAMIEKLGGRASRGADRGAAPPYDGTKAGAVVQFAYNAIGAPYVFAADGPDSFDCSGLIVAALAEVGISTEHSAHKQIAQFPEISRSELKPGDLVGFYDDLSHIGIYVGDGMVIHAPQPGESVKKAPMDNMPYNTAVRPY
jgi:cell wall-associated NlpC family hydrolase